MTVDLCGACGRLSMRAESLRDIGAARTRITLIHAAITLLHMAPPHPFKCRPATAVVPARALAAVWTSSGSATG